MALWIKGPPAKPEDLSWVPGTHMVEGEKRGLTPAAYLLHIHNAKRK